MANANQQLHSETSGSSRKYAHKNLLKCDPSPLKMGKNIHPGLGASFIYQFKVCMSTKIK
jgi:hypothetical protein